jgi:hypothetical protein
MPYFYVFEDYLIKYPLIKELIINHIDNDLSLRLFLCNLSKDFHYINIDNETFDSFFNLFNEAIVAEGGPNNINKPVRLILDKVIRTSLQLKGLHSNYKYCSRFIRGEHFLEILSGFTDSLFSDPKDELEFILKNKNDLKEFLQLLPSNKRPLICGEFTNYCWVTAHDAISFILSDADRLVNTLGLQWSQNTTVIHIKFPIINYTAELGSFLFKPTAFEGCGYLPFRSYISNVDNWGKTVNIYDHQYLDGALEACHLEIKLDDQFDWHIIGHTNIKPTDINFPIFFKKLGKGCQ